MDAHGTLFRHRGGDLYFAPCAATLTAPRRDVRLLPRTLGGVPVAIPLPDSRFDESPVVSRSGRDVGPCVSPRLLSNLPRGERMLPLWIHPALRQGDGFFAVFRTVGRKHTGDQK